MIFNFPITQDGAFRKISVAFIEKRRLGARNVMPGVQDAIFLLLNRPNLTRNDLLVRPDRTQLLFVADKDVLGAINFFYGLAHEVAAAQRVHCGAIRHQHVARRLAVALLQNLGAVDHRGILFGARNRVRRSGIASDIDAARAIALRRLLTLRSGTILQRAAAGPLIFRLRF